MEIKDNMENTLENKAKFFALYFGQKVFWHLEYGSEISILDSIHLDWKYGYCDKGYCLKIRSVKKMLKKDTDDFSLNFSYDINQYGYTQSKKRYDWTASNIDELRLRGYAVPWMGLSVEKLLEYGWIKLI